MRLFFSPKFKVCPWLLQTFAGENFHFQNGEYIFFFFSIFPWRKSDDYQGNRLNIELNSCFHGEVRGAFHGKVGMACLSTYCTWLDPSQNLMIGMARAEICSREGGNVRRDFQRSKWDPGMYKILTSLKLFLLFDLWPYSLDVWPSSPIILKSNN